MNDITTILNWVDTHRESVLAIIGGSAGVSVILEIILTKFHVDSKKIAFSMLHVFTGLTAICSWWIGMSGKAAVGTFAGLTIIAQVWHRFAVSGVNQNYVTPFLSWLSEQNEPKAAPLAVAPPAQVPTAQVVPTNTDAKPFTLDPTIVGK